MTRTAKSAVAKSSPRAGDTRPRRWVLQDAKARFSELVRCVKSEGPQLVTVHGREEVVVISVEEFRRLKGEPSGKLLLEAMKTSPHRTVELEPARSRLPVRNVVL